MARELIRFYKLFYPPQSEIPTCSAYLEGVTSEGLISIASGSYGNIISQYNPHPQYDSVNSPPIAVIAAPSGRPYYYSVWEDSSAKFVYRDGDPQGVKLYIRGTEKPQTVSSQEVFEFYVNPASVVVEENKSITKTRTRAGWEFQYWGPDITKITLQGTTGSLLNVNTATSKVDIYKSNAYQTFLKLERLYQEDHQDESVDPNALLGMNFRDRVYVGHFDHFRWEENSQRPYSFTYTLVFSVQDVATDVNLASQALVGRTNIDEYTMTVLESLVSSGG